MFLIDGAVRSLLTVSLLAVVTIQPATAQSLPACDLTASPSDCVLPVWPEEALQDTRSLFGEVNGTVWLEDAAGDAPDGGLDILAVGVGSVDIGDPAVIRESDALLRAGKVKKAVRPGENVLVRIVLDGPLSDIVDGHAGVHVATDIDRSRSNNAPAGIDTADQHFAGSEDVYSVTYATTTSETKLLDSDLSRGWYQDKDPFAAAWAAPNVLDVLVRPEAFGSGLRVVSFVSGDDGGYDSATLGAAAIPADGQVGLLPVCLEASITAEPFVVPRLVENGQTLRNVEAPASWRGGATFLVNLETQEALASLIAANDLDDTGRTVLKSTVNVFEDGLVIGQRPELQLALDGDRAELALELGLTRRGYTVLREIDLELTGDELAHAWLARATEALTETMPPFRSGKRGGLLVGDHIGACVPALITEPAPPSMRDG